VPKATKLSLAAVRMLQEKHLAQLATVMPDGTPQLTPVWVDVEDDGSYVLINTVADRLKVRNARNNAAVAVSVVDANDWQRYVIVRGKVAELTTEGADEHIEKLSWKYRGAAFHHPGDQRVILRIKPDFVMERKA
jgi:PPOX class probable F420-dependent enzyme